MEYSKEAEITYLLDQVEDILEEGKNNFLTNKVAVDRDELLEVIKEIRLKLPTELQQSVWIVEERNKILAEAQTEASLVVQDAHETLEKMVEQHEITKYAEDRAQYILENARKDSREMHNGAIEYAEDVFKDVEQKLKTSLDIVHKEVQAFEAYITDVLRVIYDHRQELRTMRHTNHPKIEQQ
ncbi:MAG: hypothetical protein ACRDDX_09945 [Cellulosilyticaceae bacterium]